MGSKIGQKLVKNDPQNANLTVSGTVIFAKFDHFWSKMPKIAKIWTFRDFGKMAKMPKMAKIAKIRVFGILAKTSKIAK